MERFAFKGAEHMRFKKVCLMFITFACLMGMKPGGEL